MLRGVDLDAAPGEILAVLGSSGAGKTTLLRAIAGLVRPDEGRIAIGGVPVSEADRELVPVERRAIGLVFQDYALFPHMTVAGNVAFGLEGTDPSASARRVDEMLGMVGLDGLRARRPAELSGGQQQRVALARALAPRPRLLLLDEPFANVDAELRRSLAEELVELVRGQGCATVLVTHDRTDALGLGDRVAVLLSPAGEPAARLAQCGSPEEVYRRPSSREVARLTGPAGTLAGQASGHRATTGLGEVELVEPRSGPIAILVRPEELRWVDDPDGPAIVRSRFYRGGSTRLGCEMDGAEIPVDTTGEGPATGARGRVEATGPLWSPA